MRAVYQVLVLLAAAAVLAELLRERSLKAKLQCALVLVPLLLRAFRIA